MASTRFRSLTIESPLGPLELGASDRGLCLCEMGSPERVHTEQRQLEELLKGEATSAAERFLEQAATELAEYFNGDRPGFTVPLDAPGSPWQRQVWAALQEIPIGTTISYGQLADRLDSPGAARAVGLANGQNRVAILIPCHRVIDATGSLRGYGGGLANKAWLLDHEQSVAGNSLFAPAGR
ncbi:MAG: O-6-methylguanine DNA methyltransferase [Phycisphaerales bacterium]|jgi:O-6-methylguanine DNA methyltransferase